MIFIIHLIFALVLFFIINWIGKNSISIGYMEITLFTQNEEAPAFNFIIRVFTPLVYLILISSILYKLELNIYVKNIYLVNVYYIAFRLFINIITGRFVLLNKSKQFLYWLSIISLSFIIYENLIKNKKNILPDFSTMANELWIIILVFIYQLINNLDLKSLRPEKRKEKYIKDNFISFKRKYGLLIKKEVKNQALEILVYAIMIYEDFNRPKVIRWFEYFVFSFSKNSKKTLGVMQYETTKIISDKESVILGAKKIAAFYHNLIQENKLDSINYDFQILLLIINDYNGGHKYETEVSSIYDFINEAFYNVDPDTLVPIKA